MKSTLKIVSILLTVLLISCGDTEKVTVTTKQADIDYDVLLKGDNKNISFVNQARPVLEKRCIVCHGCYDAPCQLKMSSLEGIKRGANPESVYNAERLFAMDPTRLFVDAHTTEEWRKKGFSSVLNESQTEPDKNIAENNLRHSVLYKMLRLKQLNPQPRIGMIDDSFDLRLSRKQTCPTNENFDKYAKKFPTQGMPFAMPNLSDDEYHILVKWISQGLPDDSKKTLPASSVKQVKQWETFLNKLDYKHQLFSRYLYEHLILGHIYFKGADTREFFQLVRSFTPPGEAIDVIATNRPFDSPGVNKFYYRLKYYKSSIVDKTHVTYEFSAKRMARYRELFIDVNYNITKLPSYSAKIATNPMKAFAEMPVNSRYKFLLDDAKFFIEGFIKGPVCRGQVALNVIEDNFWVFFTSPGTLRVNSNNEYIAEMANTLKLPAEDGNTFNVFKIWTKYWDSQKKYLLARQESFEAIPQISLDKSMKFIWDGSDGMDSNNRSLTIYRHYDSATVKQGLLGDYPESAWILDFPILERIHYLLVAGYDVYGNLGHQLNTRLYMDFLRMEAENNFLAFIPVDKRKKIQESWYRGIREDVKKYFEQPTDWLKHQVVEGYKTDDPQHELYLKLEERLIKSKDDLDYLNRCYSEDCKKIVTSKIDQQIKRIGKIKGEILVVFPDVSYVKVVGRKKNSVYTLIRNKAYKNISFILNTVENRDRSLDTISVYKGVLGSYPNFFYVVHEDDIEKFSDTVLAIKDRDDYERFVSIYGVRRTASNFWQVADWFNAAFAKQDPVGYGIYDLNRYKNR